MLIYIYIVTMYFYITLYGMIRVNFGFDWLKCDSYFIIQALMRVLLLQWIKNCLVVYIERYAVDSIDTDTIMQQFQNMKTCRKKL